MEVLVPFQFQSTRLFISKLESLTKTDSNFCWDGIKNRFWSNNSRVSHDSFLMSTMDDINMERSGSQITKSGKWVSDGIELYRRVPNMTAPNQSNRDRYE